MKLRTFLQKDGIKFQLQMVFTFTTSFKYSLNMKKSSLAHLVNADLHLKVVGVFDVKFLNISIIR